MNLKRIFDAFDILGITESIKRDVESGELPLRAAAEELYDTNRFNWVPSDEEVIKYCNIDVTKIPRDSAFTFGESTEPRRGMRVQEMYYDGCLVGYLVYKKTDTLGMFDELYRVPDVSAGIDNDGFGTFKVFYNFSDVYPYVRENLDDIAYIMENADFD